MGRLQTTNVQNDWHLLDARVDHVKIKPQNTAAARTIRPLTRG
jgi:hypothetical protein